MEVVKERLNPLPFDQDLRSTFFQQSRKWLFQKYEAWLNSSATLVPSSSSVDGVGQSRMFWLVGVGGTGKTSFLQELLRRRPNDFAGRFFFQHNTDIKSCMLRMVTTLAFQLAQSGCSDGLELEKSLAILGHDKDLSQFQKLGELFEYLITRPLQARRRYGDDKVVILLDALDEAVNFKKEAISELLAEQLQKLPGWVRFVVTSRPDNQIRHDFARFKPFEIDTQQPENKDDLENFVKDRLQNRLANGTDLAAAVGTMVGKCKGLFLYAAKIMDSTDSKNLTLEDINRFPSGMHEFYHQQLVRCKEKDPGSFEAGAMLLLEVVKVSKDALSVESLRCILGLAKSQKVRDILDMLGSLVVLSDESDTQDDGRTVKFSHKSVSDFLQECLRVKKNDEEHVKRRKLEKDSIVFDMDRGERALARACVSHLLADASAMDTSEGKSDFTDTQLQLRVDDILENPSSNLSRYAVRFVCTHLRYLCQSMEQEVYRPVLVGLLSSLQFAMLRLSLTDVHDMIRELLAAVELLSKLEFRGQRDSISRYPYTTSALAKIK